MYTSALGGGGYRNRDKVYIHLYRTRPDDDDDDDDDATDYITLYICTCKQNVRKQKQFGRYRYPRSYYLTCPTAS